MSERAVFSGKVHCALCEQVHSGYDMHEVLFTRGDVEGYEKSVRNMIFVAENVVLIGPECHKIAQHDKLAEFSVIQNLMLYEGFSKMWRLVRHFRDYLGFPASGINERERLLLNAYRILSENN